MIICKRLVHPDDHLQEAGLSGWSFARYGSIQIIICKRPVYPDDHLQEAGPSRWSFEEEEKPRRKWKRKLNGDANRPTDQSTDQLTGRIKCNLPFQKLESRRQRFTITLHSKPDPLAGQFSTRYNCNGMSWGDSIMTTLWRQILRMSSFMAMSIKRIVLLHWIFIETRKDILHGIARFRISETATLSRALLGLVCC